MHFPFGQALSRAEVIKEVQQPAQEWVTRVAVIYDFIKDELERKGDQDVGSHFRKRHGDCNEDQKAVSFQVAKQKSNHGQLPFTSFDRQRAISLSIADSSPGRALLSRLTRRVAIL